MEMKVNCRSCNGTGVFRQFGQEDDTGIRCWICIGTGYQTVKTKLDIFRGIKKRDDVISVTLNGPESDPNDPIDSIPYDTFYEDMKAKEKPE